jgi:hypothetical protein
VRFILYTYVTPVSTGGLIGATINYQTCYNENVHKPFYASGFLYHSPTQQILLQQFKNGNAVNLVLFRGSSRNGETPQAVFQQCVEKALGAKIDASQIHPVYDYVHEQLGEQFVFYVEVVDATPKEYKSKNKTEWLPFTKVPKRSMSEQTHHDIVVGERVIRSIYETAHPQDNPRRNH